MPAKRKTVHRKRKPQRGKGVLSILKKVGNFVKDQKLISRGLGMIPDPRAQVAGQVAGLVGLGRKRRVVRRRPAMVGRGIFGDLGSGIGSIFGGLGGGVGSIAKGLFGGSKGIVKTNY